MSTASRTAPLTEMTATEMAALIAAGEVSSAELIDQQIARIEAINPTINALTQPMFDAARANAEAADKATGPSGLLHGVPVTIKDCFAVRGAETTLGIPGYSRGPADADAPLVARLRAAGAIVLGKTNVPQAMLLHECDNPVFGRTLHPNDDERSPGGSTGGEAALVAACGSPLGLASDLGGSIRQPAAACGLFGFKPSTGTLTLAGSERAISRGMQAIAIQPGPLCRSAADVDLAMRALTNPAGAARQATESAVPWHDFRQVDPASLRIATWTDDGLFTPAAGVARAVGEAATHLRRKGAEVIEVAPPGIEAMLRVYLGLVSADGMACVRRHVRGGAVDPQLARQLRLARIPRLVRSALKPLLRMAGQPELAQLLGWTGARSAGDYWRLAAEAESYRQSFWPKLERLADGPIDAVLSPAYGLPALKHGAALHLLRAASHAFLANLLDAPAGVAPWGQVSAADESAELASRDHRGVGNHYARENAKGSTGLPLAVEVMAPRGHDQTVVALLAALEPEGAREPVGVNRPRV